MRYCKKTGEELSFPDELPNRSGNIAGGFAKMPQSQIRKQGYFPYIEPVFDPATQRAGKLVFDKKTQIVTREIVAIIFDIEQEKAKRIQELKTRANSLLSETDWHVIRMAERGTSISEKVAASRESIRSQVQKIETEIAGIKTVKEVLNYQITLI